MAMEWVGGGTNSGGSSDPSAFSMRASAPRKQNQKSAKAAKQAAKKAARNQARNSRR